MSTRVAIQHAKARGHPHRGYGLILLCALALVLLSPASVAAHGTESERLPHALNLTIAFPDDGLSGNDLLCVALFAGAAGDLTAPSQSLCLKAGETTLFFEGLTHGPYTVLIPAPGSEIDGDRYRGQVIDTEIPDSPSQDAFGIPVVLELSPAAAGTTGSVEITVFGCPPGTDEGGDAESWENKCHYLASEIPLSLSGVGSIDDTSADAVTGEEAEPGRAKFSNLPAGAYEIEGQLPVNVADEPVVFVESNIDSSVTALDPDDTLALRPAEIKSVNLFVVIEPKDAASTSAPDSTTPLDDPATGNPDAGDAPISPPAVGLSDPEVTSGLTPTAEPPAPAETAADAPVDETSAEAAVAPTASPTAEETP